MAAPIDLAATKDALIVLATAGVVVPLMRRFRVGSTLAFLLVGVALGPHGLGRLAGELPWLSPFTVGEPEAIGRIAEFGVVFLLFLIGLELSLPRLLTMRRLVFGFGALQVALSAALLGGLALALGAPPAAALVLGAALALSSTAIVVELLADGRRTASTTGRAAFAVLLFQDLAVVPVLLLVGILGVRGEGAILANVALALAQAALALALIVGVGRLVLRPLFRLVAGADSPELFTAAALFVAVGTAVLAAAAGLSMALGAFVAGLLLAETEYRRALEATIEPFKGLLLGAFFFSVGMGVDPAAIAREPGTLAAAVIGLVALKALVVAGLARSFGLAPATAVEAALLLGPAGEFAFIVVGLSVASGVVPAPLGAFALTAASLSMMILPALAGLGRRLGARVGRRAAPPPAAAEPPPADGAARAIVVGDGRVGRLVGEMLARHEVPFLAIERDAAAVARARAGGRREVYWGDAANPAFLARCGLERATALVVTAASRAAIDEVVGVARGLRGDLVIVARARDTAHAARLYALGASDAVPETVEASLQLSEAALVGLGVPLGRVIASVHDERDRLRRDLQLAAGRATRAVRAPRQGARP